MKGATITEDGKIVISKPKEAGETAEAAETEEVTLPSAKASKLPPDGQGSAKKRFKVIINQQDSFDGKYDVPLGINGKVNLVKRGVEVVLDEDYLQVLKDSQIDQIVKNDDGEDEIVTIARYSFSILGEVK